jgi:hypothetical protein
VALSRQTYRTLILLYTFEKYLSHISHLPHETLLLGCVPTNEFHLARWFSHHKRVVVFNVILSQHLPACKYFIVHIYCNPRYTLLFKLVSFKAVDICFVIKVQQNSGGKPVKLWVTFAYPNNRVKNNNNRFDHFHLTRRFCIKYPEVLEIVITPLRELEALCTRWILSQLLTFIPWSAIKEISDMDKILLSVIERYISYLATIDIIGPINHPSPFLLFLFFFSIESLARTCILPRAFLAQPTTKLLFVNYKKILGPFLHSFFLSTTLLCWQTPFYLRYTFAQPALRTNSPFNSNHLLPILNT